PLDMATEVLVLLEPALAALEQQASLPLEPVPSTRPERAAASATAGASRSAPPSAASETTGWWIVAAPVLRAGRLRCPSTIVNSSRSGQLRPHTGPSLERVWLRAAVTSDRNAVDQHVL